MPYPPDSETRSGTENQFRLFLHHLPPSTAHSIIAKDADAHTYSELLKPIGHILSNATLQLWCAYFF